MTDTRTVVLALSPRAAEAVRTALYPARDAAELDSFDNEANTITSALLAGVIVEVSDQLANLDAPATSVAERMAQAAAKAVKAAADNVLPTPEPTEAT